MDDLEYFEDGIRSGRPESPDVEHAFQDAVKRALVELFESKGLYQNVTIDKDFAAGFANSQALIKEICTRPLFLFARSEDEPGTGIPGHTGELLRTPQEKMEVGCYLPNVNIYCNACKSITLNQHTPTLTMQAHILYLANRRNKYTRLCIDVLNAGVNY